MSGASPNDRRARLPHGLLGALSLVLLAEAAIGRGRYELADPNLWDAAASAAAARVEARSRAILCFGDSMMKLGVIPPVVERRAGRRAFNLAVIGSRAPSSYFLLRRALDAGARPEAVLVTFFPRLLREDSWFLPQPLAAELGLRDALELCWTSRDPCLFLHVATHRLIPSVRAREVLRLALTTRLGGGQPAWGRDVEPLRRDWARFDGALVSPSRPGLAYDFAAKRLEIFPFWYLDPINAHYILEFLDLAGARRIPVFLLVPPMMPGLQAECERSGFDARYTLFLDRLRARYPGLVVVDGRRAGYDPAVFTDPNHLGREGAFVFSQEVGDILRRHLDAPSATPRLVDLPPYRPRPVDLDATDLARSGATDEARAPSRR
jgi:hypothetical protein